MPNLYNAINAIVSEMVGERVIVDPDANMMNAVKSARDIVDLTLEIEDCLGMEGVLDDFDFIDTPLTINNIIAHLRNKKSVPLSKLIPATLIVECPVAAAS